MPDVMEWPQDEALAVVTRAVQHLREGRLVVFPTESVYAIAAGALHADAMASLDRALGTEEAANLILGQAVEVFDWLPFFRGVGIRLARRFWPGPLTLTSGMGLRQGLRAGLPEALRQRLAPREQLGVRLPDHAAIRQTAMLLEMPLVAVSTPWITAEEALASMGESAGMIIQDGRTAFAQLETVVEVKGREWKIVREGAIPASEIEAAASCRILFLCTGNTCRSPLAEALCRKLLADRLGCDARELCRHGFVVQSAGMAAAPGAEASAEAVVVAAELGADLSTHRSQPLTMELLHQSDRLFTMTASHLRMLHGVRGVRPRLLSPLGDDVADPIGGTPEMYRECAQQIMNYLDHLLPELLEC